MITYDTVILTSNIDGGRPFNVQIVHRFSKRGAST